MARSRFISPALFALGLGALIATAVGAQTDTQRPSSPTSPTTSAPEAETPPPDQQAGQQAGQRGDESPRRAIALLEPTEGNSTRGVVTFEEASDGVRMQANISGLPGAVHAYHVHVYGDCSSADATSAGPHFTFGPADTGVTGDLGELRPQGGSATDTKTIPLAELRGDNSIIGRAVVVHERGNDHSQPPEGDAGARLACGVIGFQEAEDGA